MSAFVYLQFHAQGTQNIIVASTPLATTTKAADYRGIYVLSIPSKHGQTQTSDISDAVYASPSVDGIVIELLWSDVEPSPGQYDWSLLDGEVNAAISHNKNIAIAVMAGAMTPTWLYAAPYNVPHDTFLWSSHGGNTGKTCEPYVLPAPWDSQYEQAFADMMQALSTHLKSIPGAYNATTRVKLTGINTITDELHLAFCANSNGLSLWQQLGYTPDKIYGAGVNLMQAVNTAFPDKILALNIIENGGLPNINNAGQAVSPNDPSNVDVKQELINYALSPQSGFKDRFAVQWNGFNSDPTSAAPSVIAAGKAGAIVGWQTNDFGGQSDGTECNGKTTAAVPCTEAGYQAILDAMIADQGQYLEVFPINIPQFPNALAEAHLRLFSTAL